jgi:predicted RNA-binding protein with PIN domain
MPTLIDGHNLIGKLPDIDLADPDDEARLVLKLRTYCARNRKKVTVVFDHGLPGGKSHELSGGGVDVRFASTTRTADGILRERIRNSNNPRGLTVVTSDRRIIVDAEARGARVIRSEDFVNRLAGGPTEDATRDSKPATSDVDYWMAQFEKGKGKKGR